MTNKSGHIKLRITMSIPETEKNAGKKRRYKRMNNKKGIRIYVRSAAKRQKISDQGLSEAP